MRSALIICAALLGVLSVHEATASEASVNVRPIAQSSTDVFDVLTQLLRAKAAYQSGDFAAAYEGYRYVHFHDPSQTEAALGYADAALALGQVNLAQTLYRELETKEAQAGILLCGVIIGDIDAPEAALRQALETNAGDARLWNTLGRILDAETRGSEARQAYSMAGMAGQRAGVTENNLGQSFLAEEQIETALTHFTRATLQAPSDHVFDNNRRLALLLQQEYVAAIRGLPADKASALLGDAGIIAARHGDKKLAIYLFEKAQALSPRYNAKLAAHIERTQN